MHPSGSTSDGRRPAWLATLARLALLAGCLAGAGTSGAAAAPARWSQLAEPVFSHVLAEHGPPNLATALAQDGQGFLWIGSFGGLARWDGYRLRTYLPRAGDPHALPDNIVQALHTDSAGRLWIGTNSHGVARYDSATDRFISLPVGPNGVAHVSVLSLCDDGHGAMLVGTDGGLDRIEIERASGAVLGVQHDREVAALPDQHVRAIVRGRDGSLWLGTDKGLYRRAPGAALAPVALPLAQQPEVDSMAEASDGSIWLGTRGHGAFSIPPGGAAQAVRESGPGPATLANESVYAVGEARPGQVWLGTFGQGIVAVDSASGQTRRMRHDARVASSLVHDSVWAILRDRSGLVWAATGRGLSQHDPNQQALLTVLGAVGGDGLSDTDVFALHSGADGRLWAGLGNNGVDLLDPHGARVAHLAADPAHPDTALPKDRVVAFAAGAGVVYMATPRGVYRSTPGGGAVSRLALPSPGPALRVNALAVTAGDRLWIGARDSGLWRQERGGAARRVGADGPATLVDQRITALAPGLPGQLWVGTRNGLDRIDTASLAVTHLLASPGQDALLPSGYVTSLLTDRRGRLWVGTYGGGIVVLDQPNGGAQLGARRLGSANGLPSENIAHLLQERSGAVWASTDNGIARINPATLAVRALQRADGVALNNAWIGSGAVTGAGEILFGGSGGLTVIRPELLRPWTYRPPLAVTDVRVGGQPRAAGAAIEIEQDANALVVEFAALDYSAPERNRYAYRLDGYERNWTETDASRRLASYTNLPPGQYRLLLRGSNRNGEWSEATLALPVDVLPAWYQTIWWRTLVLLALAATVLWIVRRRTAYLARHGRQLEEEVARQTATLRAQQDALVEANRGLNDANAELAVSNDTLRQLGEVGRDITANLDAQAVFEALRQHVTGLLDAAHLSLYQLDAAGSALELAFASFGDKSWSNAIAIDDPVSYVALAARERREVSVELGSEGPDYVPGELVLSAEFAPLIANGRLLGVMQVESTRAHAYGGRERMIFRTLCAYGAIALVNAQARALLVQQEKLASLGGMLAGMAHGVNTPLGTVVSAISGAAATLQELRSATDSGKVNKSLLERATRDAAEFADLALRNAMRAAELMDSFKAVLTQRDSEFAETLELAAFLPQVATLAHRRLEEQGHQVSYEVEHGLHAQLIADALAEALTRVLANVADHAFADGRPGSVRVSARATADGKIEIVVADDGMGIAAADLGRVFDPFFTTRSGSGNHVGLGLNIAFNHVTERLKGTISIDSAPGAGTRVTLRV